MDLNKLTTKSQEALQAAQTKALRFGHQEVDGEHLEVDARELEGAERDVLLGAREVIARDPTALTVSTWATSGGTPSSARARSS